MEGNNFEIFLFVSSLFILKEAQPSKAFLLSENLFFADSWAITIFHKP